MQHISKRASNERTLVRSAISFANARSAFEAVLRSLMPDSSCKVLLPSYIGWSSREGSGVFDPVRQVGVSYDFYRMTRDLRIDVDDLISRLAHGDVTVLVLIHYFGYPDPSAKVIAYHAREQGVVVIEDEAHALLSDWIGGTCGRWGDACIYSLHKILPFSDGGLLVANNTVFGDKLGEVLRASTDARPLDSRLLCYDLYGVSQARRRNARALLDLIRPVEDVATPLFRGLPDGVVPQTLPVLVDPAIRDALYSEMNSCGFGVVSLYHTLVETINRDTYSDSHWLSRRILNLPVHQDVDVGALALMVDTLVELHQTLPR